MENVRKVVTDLFQRVTRAQEHVKTIQTIVDSWSHHPMFKRIDEHKCEALFNVKDRDEIKTKRYEEVHAAAIKICKLVEEWG